MVMWDEIAAEVAAGFPSVKVEKMLVDAMTVRMVLQPHSLDTIVATNLVRLLSSASDDDDDWDESIDSRQTARRHSV